MISTPQDPKEPFDLHKATVIMMLIMTIGYSLRGLLWLAIH